MLALSQQLREDIDEELLVQILSETLSSRTNTWQNVAKVLGKARKLREIRLTRS